MNAPVNPRRLTGNPERASRIATPVRERAPRPRAVELDSDAPKDTAHIAALKEYVRANKAKNAATREESAAKKSLERAMASSKMPAFSHVVDGMTYDVTFKPGEKDFVDVKELYGKVDLDTFLQIVGASQGAVKEMAGSVILAQVLKTEKTEAAVKVSQRKN